MYNNVFLKFSYHYNYQFQALEYSNLFLQATLKPNSNSFSNAIVIINTYVRLKLQNQNHHHRHHPYRQNNLRIYQIHFSPQHSLLLSLWIHQYQSLLFLGSCPGKKLQESATKNRLSQIMIYRIIILLPKSIRSCKCYQSCDSFGMVMELVLGLI